MRPQRAGNRDPFAYGWIDVVQKIGRVSGVEVCRFRRIDSRAAPYREIAIKVALAGKLDGVQEGNVGRLDTNLIV